MTRTKTTQPVHKNDLKLPRLLYIGDVPIEGSYHGSALLYRLLQDYPSQKLHIIEGNLVVSQPERRLPGIEYQQMRVGNQRWLNTRFSRYLRSWLLVTAKNRTRSISKLLVDFQPDAVLTVANGYSWLTAAQWAKQHSLPLHLILHDDWIPTALMLEPVRKWLDNEFGHIYSQAKSRLCVSPFMVEEYHHRYGISGTVLYPSRAKDVVAPTKPVIKGCETDRSLNIVYGGTINNSGYVRALQNVAECLEKLNGQLIIYGPLTKETAIRSGLNHPNIFIGGLLAADRFIEHIRQEADVLFLPMSFDSQAKVHMQTSFPSKLTDYTATGLPLLIYGPPYCSAVRWAKENEGVAEIVDREDLGLLAKTIENLSKNPEKRFNLANNALIKGNQFFEHNKVIENLYQKIALT